jgi:hypothetical protein
VRHSAIALSGAQTNSSNTQRGLWLGKDSSEANNPYRRNLRSPGSLELNPIGLNMQDSVSLQPFLGVLAVTERHGLIAKESPPRWYRSASCEHVARHGGLGDAETEHQKLAMDPWRTPEKVLTAIRTIRWRTSLETLGCPPRQRPRSRYRQSADQPSRC